MQGDSFNASRIATTVVVALTSNVRLAAAPGNVLLPAERTGLPKDSVANVSQIVSVDRSLLGDRVGRLTAGDLGLVARGDRPRARPRVTGCLHLPVPNPRGA